MTAVDVDALAKLREAATAGPWRVPYPFTKLVDAPGSTDNLAIIQCDNAADATLIVAAVNFLPALLAEVREGRARRERLERLAKEWGGRELLAHPVDVANSIRAVLAAGDPS